MEYTIEQIQEMIKILPVPMIIDLKDLNEIYKQDEL